MRIQKPIRGRLPDLTGIFGRGLILNYPFNELGAGTVYDQSGHRHDGTLRGNVSWAGGGLNFPGAGGDYVEVADHKDFTPAGTPFSIFATILMRDAFFFQIASKGVEDANGEWMFAVFDNDKLTIAAYDESEATCHIGRLYNTALTPYENKMIHVGMTYDGGILCSGFKLYLFGNRVDDTDYESNKANFVEVEPQGQKVYIGQLQTAPLIADGLILNMMMWNRELLADEARLLNELMYPLYE